MSYSSPASVSEVDLQPGKPPVLRAEAAGGGPGGGRGGPAGG